MATIAKIVSYDFKDELRKYHHQDYPYEISDISYGYRMAAF